MKYKYFGSNVLLYAMKLFKEVNRLYELHVTWASEDWNIEHLHTKPIRNSLSGLAY